LEAMPTIVKQVRDVSFLVIGGGEEEGRLRQMAGNLGIADHVIFTGWVKDPEAVRKLLMDCAFAVAPYDPGGATAQNFTYYADPTKIKTYLSCGLPIVMTDVPHNADDLEKRGCAVIIDYDGKLLAKAIIGLFTDVAKLKRMRKSAIETAGEFTWEKIFKHAFL